MPQAAPTDSPLAATLGPLVRAVGLTVKQATDALATAGFRALQLDATLPGIRPRDLNTRARRDLAATAARAGMTLAGLAFFLPRAHYALAATFAAIDLAADLGRVPLSLSFPVADASTEVRAALVTTADAHSVPLAVHAEDTLEKLLAWLNSVDLPLVGAGLDPAAALASALDPAATIHRLARRLVVARLGDWGGGSSPADASRLPVGQGHLDVLGYRVAMELVQTRRARVGVALRPLPDPLKAAQAAAAAWRAAGPA